MTDYYVTTDPVDGDDSNNGLSPTGVTGPWATIVRAATGVAAGDTLYLVVHQDDAEFEEDNQAEFLAAGTSESAIISVFGANANGEVDGTIATWKAGSGHPSGNQDAFQFRTPYHLLMNIRVKGEAKASNGIELNGSNSRALIFINMVIENCRSNGFMLDDIMNGGCINCVTINKNVSSPNGFSSVNGPYENSVLLYNCVSFDNDLIGCKNPGLAINCTIRHNDTKGIQDAMMLINNTIYNNGDDAADFDDLSGMAINCVVSDNADDLKGQRGETSAKTHAIIKTAFRNDSASYIRENIDQISLTADPFVQSTPTGVTSDLNLNRGVAGEACKDVAWPAVWQIGATGAGGVQGPTAANGFIEVPNFGEVGAVHTKKPANIDIETG